MDDNISKGKFRGLGCDKMKKFVSGILVGLMLFVGTSVFAESISKLIGAKVQGIYELEKNGKALGEAVIINGKAYAPVRTVSEAAGVGLTIEGKKIKMTDITVNETGDYVLGPDALKLANEKSKLSASTGNKKSLLTAAFSTLKMYEDSLAADAARETPIPGYADGLNANIIKTQAEITKLQQEIATAESDMANLQTQIDAMKP